MSLQIMMNNQFWFALYAIIVSIGIVLWYLLDRDEAEVFVTPVTVVLFAPLLIGNIIIFLRGLGK